MPWLDEIEYRYGLVYYSLKFETVTKAILEE